MWRHRRAASRKISVCGVGNLSENFPFLHSLNCGGMEGTCIYLGGRAVVLDCGEGKLHTKVNNFKRWAKANYPEVTEKNDNGEWCFCTEFYEMVSEAIRFMKKNSTEKATQQVIDDLLYAIARDNEDCTIIEELEQYSEWFSLLCRCCLNTDYINAKWQFAEYLSGYRGDDDLQELIFEFLNAGDEYTERLALKTLADIHPEKARNMRLISGIGTSMLTTNIKK